VWSDWKSDHELSTEVLIVRDKERASNSLLISDEFRWLKCGVKKAKTKSCGKMTWSRVCRQFCENDEMMGRREIGSRDELWSHFVASVTYPLLSSLKWYVRRSVKIRLMSAKFTFEKRAIILMSGWKGQFLVFDLPQKFTQFSMYFQQVRPKLSKLSRNRFQNDFWF